MSQKYSEEYYTLKAELAEIKEQLSAFENAGGRAQRFVKLTERYADFAELTPAILNEFISRIEVHERDQKRTFLEKTVMTDHARRILDGLTAQNAPTAPAQSAETAAHPPPKPPIQPARAAQAGA